MNDFSTIRHLGDNANLSNQKNNLIEILFFLFGQAAVAGPASFILMLGIIVASRNERHASWLIWMALPVLVLMGCRHTLARPIQIGQ